MWIGWLLLVLMMYLLFRLLRGGVQFVYWFFEEYFEERREVRRQAARAAHRDRHRDPHAETRKPDESTARPERRAAASVSRPPQHSSGIAKLPKLLKLAMGGKSYDYWVSCAMVEEDAALKVQFLTKAIQRNPTYAPAWVLKANALLESKRYAEALDCYGHALELHDTPLVRYRRGLCLFHLHRPQEAMEALAKALAECRHDDRELAEEIRGMKKQIEAELPAKEPT